MNYLLRVQVYEAEGYVVKQMKSVIVRVVMDVVSCIAVLQVWHHNEWLFVQYICPKELKNMRVTKARPGRNLAAN